MSQHWLTLLIVLLIIAIIADGIRRMRKAKKDSIKMSLKKHFDDDLDDDVIYGSEFPNGGARSSEAEIDKERIMKARSKYNFGDDLPRWNKSNADKAVQSPQSPTRAGEPSSQDAYVSEKPVEAKIEPSISSTDEVLDERSSTVEYEAPAPQSTPSKVADEPIQTSLNLDDDVPMLMEKIDGPETKNAENQAESIAVSETETVEQTPEITEVVEKSIQNIASKIEPSISDIDIHSANKPRYESKYTNHADQRGRITEDVIVINLRARQGELLGSDLLPLILDNGLRFGAMDIFHYHAEEDGEGDVLFSMANIVKPGTFDLAHFEVFETVGLSFFLTLPVTVGSHMDAFDKMANVTQAMADALDAELLDENRSILTRQTIEHYRERVRDFSRREQLEKNK